MINSKFHGHIPYIHVEKVDIAGFAEIAAILNCYENDLYTNSDQNDLK